MPPNKALNLNTLASAACAAISDAEPMQQPQNIFVTPFYSYEVAALRAEITQIKQLLQDLEARVRNIECSFPKARFFPTALSPEAAAAAVAVLQPVAAFSPPPPAMVVKPPITPTSPVTAVKTEPMQQQQQQQQQQQGTV